VNTIETRWTLRQAVREVNQELGALGLDKHPGKTFIGRIERGFDFLGYHFSPRGLTVARTTVEKFVARVTQLYEHERERPEGPSALGKYVRRWVGWAGLGQVATGQGITVTVTETICPFKVSVNVTVISNRKRTSFAHTISGSIPSS